MRRGVRYIMNSCEAYSTKDWYFRQLNQLFHAEYRTHELSSSIVGHFDEWRWIIEDILVSNIAVDTMGRAEKRCVVICQVENRECHMYDVNNTWTWKSDIVSLLPFRHKFREKKNWIIDFDKIQIQIIAPMAISNRRCHILYQHDVGWFKWDNTTPYHVTVFKRLSNVITWKPLYNQSHKECLF